MRNSEITFSFGQNWKDFLDSNVDEEHFQKAVARTRELLRMENLHGLTFLDIGCGSGLFSRVAYFLGAEKVISLDVDPLSVECCQKLRAQAGSPANWQVLHGSILDAEFVRTLPKADVVYSWGVLHHTGNMWQAIRNAASLVSPGGKFAIAIYNKLEYRSFKNWRGSYYWLRVKRAYNRASKPMKRVMEGTMAAKEIALMLAQFRNPFAEVRGYKDKRGMKWWYDIVDWLGGYPYEFATSGELFHFFHDELGMQLEHLYSASSIGCHEMLFKLPQSTVKPTSVSATASQSAQSPH